MRKLVISLAILTAMMSPSGRDATADGQNDNAKIEAKLTPTIAQAAIADMIRSKSCAFLKDLDADEWARKEIRDEGKGTWSIGGLFYMTPKEFKYSFTVMPRPGVQACAIGHEGTFKLQSGKWVAQSPEVKSYAQQVGK